MSKINKHSKVHTPRQKRTTFKKHSNKYAKVYAPYLPVLFIVALFIGSLNFGKNINHEVLSTSTGISEESLLNETNQEREKSGIENLKINSKLSYAAKLKADDMVAKNYWSHISPEGYEPWVFVERAEYNYLNAAENLAYGFKESSSVVNGWMNSPTHKAIMLDANMTEVGFGVANSENYLGKGEQKVIVALYGKPASSSQINEEALGTSYEQPKRVSFIESTFSKGNLINFAAGLAAGILIMYLFIKHSLAIRRSIKSSEKFIIKHPALDAVVLFIILACIFLLRTVGHIN